MISEPFRFSSLSPQDKYESKNFRVVQEFKDGQQEYGSEGLCMRADKTEDGGARLHLMCADKDGKLSKIVVSAEHCAEVDPKARKPRNFFDFRRQSHDKKVRMLGRNGMTDVQTSAPLEPVVAKNFKPQGYHIQLWMTLLEQVFPDMIGYNVEHLEHLLRLAEKEDDDSDEAMRCKEIRKQLEAEIQKSVKTRGRHLLPIHCPQQPEHPDGHWTLLSLEKANDESPVTVRYFETLNKANEVCLSRANKLLEVCGLGKVPEPCNVFRQGGDDCTWWVLHYIEVETRRHHGEGDGACFAIGNAQRKPQLRHQIKLATDQLQAARLKWLAQEKRDQAMVEAVRRNMQKRMGRIKYARTELERLRQRATIAAEEIHSGSKDLEDPEIYVDNKKKLKEEMIKMAVKKALKEIEEIGRDEELKKKAKQEEAMYEEFKKKAKAKQEEDEKMN